MDVDVTLVEASNDKRWQDFSSDWEDFSDWQGFSAAKGELQSFGTIFLVLVLEWLGVLLAGGLLIFLFVVTLVDVLFEAPIERDEQAGC